MSFGPGRISLPLLFFGIVCFGFILYFIQYYSGYHNSKRKACADFNTGIQSALEAGVHDAYICPRDGIAQVICSESYPVKSIETIETSHLTMKDILVYVLIGSTSNVDALLWWLEIVNEPLDVAFIADACPIGMTVCNDPAQKLLETVQKKFTHIRFQLNRVMPSDGGYIYLSCKMRRGAQMVYNQYPEKKFYFKVDGDTVLFPKRLLHFLRTLDTITHADTQPLYFGTAIETGVDLLLCGRHWKHEGNIEKGGLCYAQGGAGYGLNNMAMRAMATAPMCDPLAQSKEPEDTYVGLRTYDSFKTTVIHCGGFGSSGLMNEERLKRSISFHHVESEWLRTYGKTLIRYAS